MDFKLAGLNHCRVPPPLAPAARRSRLAGLDILEEHPGELGMVLWKSVRSMELWGASAHRGSLFSEGSAEARRERLKGLELDADASAALESVARLLENPRHVEVSELVGACGAVSRWAESQGKLATALAFAQAAVLADPEGASGAYRVGRLARMRADYEQAESWFEHAIILARRSKNWLAYAEAYAGLGNLYVQKGNFPRAKLHHLRCLRVSRRYALHEMEGAALHNLFGIAIECSVEEQAEEYARLALEAYPPCSSGLPRLAHDVAYHWIRQGFFARALPVIQEVLSLVLSPSTRAVVLGDLARAAGGAGDTEIFEHAWAQAWLLLSNGEAEEGSARTLVGLAHGAASLGEWKRAERAAMKAMEIATMRKEGQIVMTTEEMIGHIREAVWTQLQTASVAPQPSSEQLAGEFVQALQRLGAVAVTT